MDAVKDSGLGADQAWTRNGNPETKGAGGAGVTEVTDMGEQGGQEGLQGLWEVCGNRDNN